MPEGELTAEIGPRTSPILHLLREDLRPGNWVFVERDASAAEKLHQRTKESAVVQADVGKLSFKDQSVDSLIMANVFGQEGVHEWTEGQGFTGRKVRVGDPKHITKELFRVTKPGGSLVIIESYTPADEQTLVDAATEAGFLLAEAYTKENGDLEKIFSQSENPEIRTMRDSFIEVAALQSYALVFKKQE